MKKVNGFFGVIPGMLIALSFFAAFDAFAGPCKCEFGSPGTPANGLRDMDVIFIGKVVSIEEAKDARGFLDVAFEASKYYKGQEGASVLVRTPEDIKNCGFQFNMNKAYLVYAKYRDAILFTDACLRTRTMEKANAEGDISTLDMIVFAGQVETEMDQTAHLDFRLRDVLKADAVFSGEVLGIEPSKGEPNAVDVTFAVHASYSVGKSLEPTVVVRTPKDVQHGGVDFTTSKRNNYIVYAYDRNGVLYTSVHSRTKDYDKAARDGDLEVLNSLKDGMQAYGKDLAEIFPGLKKDKDKLPDSDALWNAVRKIVLSYYPGAQFTVKKDHLTFEYNTRYIVLGDVTTSGALPNVKIVKGPQKDGIFGDISLVYDPHYNYYMDIGWSNYKSHGWTRMFPGQEIEIAMEEKGSKKYSCYIYVTLISRLDGQKAIKTDFEKLIDNFEAYF